MDSIPPFSESYLFWNGGFLQPGNLPLVVFTLKRSTQSTLEWVKERINQRFADYLEVGRLGWADDLDMWGLRGDLVEVEKGRTNHPSSMIGAATNQIYEY